MLAEQHNLLPENHFSGRPGRTTTDAVHVLAHRVKDAWRVGKVVSAVLLDISQAFPTVCHERLLDNMRKRRIPENIVSFVASFLAGQATYLQFADFESGALSIPTGVPQGSLLSPILYLFSSADLLEITNDRGCTAFSGGYIDGTMIVAVSESIESNIEILLQLMSCCLDWSARHACQFNVKKFQLIHFTKNYNHEAATTLGLEINGTTIEPQRTVKYLGILIDSKLHWKEQAEAAVAKATVAASCDVGRSIRENRAVDNGPPRLV